MQRLELFRTLQHVDTRGSFLLPPTTSFPLLWSTCLRVAVRFRTQFGAFLDVVRPRAGHLRRFCFPTFLNAILPAESTSSILDCGSDVESHLIYKLLLAETGIRRLALILFSKSVIYRERSREEKRGAGYF